MFGRVLRRLPVRREEHERRVALTFDDGPNPDATPLILDVLGDEGIPATFFMLGRHVERWPELARRVVAEGHVAANHGFHHRKLHVRGPAFVRIDIALGAQCIAEATGCAVKHFRAPHGFRSPWVSRIARDLGQQPVGWTLGVWDTDLPGEEVIFDRVIDGVRPGSILLFHDGDANDSRGDRTQTAAALPAIIRELKRNGYSFARLPA